MVFPRAAKIATAAVVLLVPALVVAATLASCSLDKIGRMSGGGEIGEDAAPPTVPSDPETTDGWREAPGPTCAHTCLAAPQGWTGPFALGQGATECGQEDLVRDWARSVGSAVSAPPAQCTCSCGTLTASCDVRLRAIFEKKNCNMARASYLVPGDGGCRPIFVYDHLQRTDQPSSPRCPAVADAAVPGLDASSEAVGCVPRRPEGCEAGVCFPPVGAGVRLCVRLAADAGAGAPGADAGVACPTEYPNAVSLSGGVEDTRGCSPCTCVPRAGWGCTGVEVTVYDNMDCTGSRTTVSAGCASGYGDYESARVTRWSVTGSCDPYGGTPIGNVVQVPGEIICCK